MKQALFPGTFDPPSLGHLCIIRRAQAVCDKLYVGIAENIRKDGDLFSMQEKIDLLTAITGEMPYVEVVPFSGLVVDFAKTHGIDFLIRGMRAFSDLEYECRMAYANRRMSGLETVLLLADQQYAHISGSLIREIGSLGGDLSPFIPEAILEKVQERCGRGGQAWHSGI